MFDTHAHLNFKDYDKDREQVIEKSLKKGLKILSVGTNYEESVKVLDIAKKYQDNIFSAVGLHPLYLDEEYFEDSKYRELAGNKEVVAIGETGLDYKYIKNDEAKRRQQKRVFREHLILAKDLELPVIIHCRQAHRDMIDFLKKTEEHSGMGVIHCFTGSKQELREYLDLGLHIGINGVVFKLSLDKVLKEVPLEKVLLETDCPFLSPVESIKRNEPLLMTHVAQYIAKIKKISFEEVVEVTTANAHRLFINN